MSFVLVKTVGLSAFQSLSAMMWFAPEDIYAFLTGQEVRQQVALNVMGVLTLLIDGIIQQIRDLLLAALGA